jgi:hypothetical protein
MVLLGQQIAAEHVQRHEPEHDGEGGGINRQRDREEVEGGKREISHDSDTTADGGIKPAGF